MKRVWDILSLCAVLRLVSGNIVEACGRDGASVAGISAGRYLVLVFGLFRSCGVLHIDIDSLNNS